MCARQVLCHSFSPSILVQKMSAIRRLGEFYSEHPHLLPGLYYISLHLTFWAFLNTPASTHLFSCSVFELLALQLPKSQDYRCNRNHTQLFFPFSFRVHSKVTGRLPSSLPHLSTNTLDLSVRLHCALTDQGWAVGGTVFTAHVCTNPRCTIWGRRTRPNA